MNVNYKGVLQEYCQNRCFPLPKYRILKQSGPPHSPRFQVEVGVNGEWFTGEASCLTKKEAEQSAAQIACEALSLKKRNPTVRQSHSLQTTVYRRLPYLMPISPSYSSSLTHNSMKHMPPQYADSERFILKIVKFDGGRIRKIWAPDKEGKYQFEITGTYRYCENVHQHHRKNHIYFIVDPIQKTYYQKCHDPECFGFESFIKHMSTNQENASIRRRSYSPTNDSIIPKRSRQDMV